MCRISTSAPAVLAAVLGLPLLGLGPRETERFALEVRVIGINGAPVEKSSITLWRLIPEPRLHEKPDNKRARSFWREPATGNVWEPVGGVATNDRWRRDDLPAGTYRATAHLGHHGAMPNGMSEAVMLDNSRNNKVLAVRLRACPTLVLRLFDVATGEPLSGGKVDLVCGDANVMEPPGWAWNSPGSAKDGRITIEHLPPGTYRLTASRWASTPDDLAYSATEKERRLVVAPGHDQLIQVAMVGRPLEKVEIENRWGWVTTGTVVDEAGRPVAGANVQAATGWGTLYGGGSTRTDEAGRFTLRFGEGWASPDAANLQAAVFTVTKDGYVEKSRSRPGRHAMARRIPAASGRQGFDSEKIILKGMPYRIDFQLARPATIEANLRGTPELALWVIGRDDSSGSVSSTKDGPNRWALLPGEPWRFAVPYRKTRYSVRSFPLTLPQPGHYRATLHFIPDPERGVDLLELDSITGPDGRDIRNQVVVDEPLARPPVPEALQQRARDLLQKMAETNQAWLGAAPPEARNYEYRFRFTGKEGKTFSVGDAPASGAARRGVSYYSSIHFLVSHPANATFRQVEIGDDHAALAYTLKEPITVSAGNGVAREWHGFFSMPWREGVLTLDARRFTPVENRSAELTEIFSQYIDVGNGRFVPLAIKLDNQGMRFDWTFQVVEPALWLFESGSSDRGESMVQLDQIKVNGVAAKIIAQGKHETHKAN